MDYRDLLTNAHYIALSGNVLTVEERAGLQSSLVLLQNENHFYKTVYWGKVTGIQNDYHVAQGYRESVMGKRVTFYSSDSGVSWNQIDTHFEPEEAALVEQIKGLLVGDPSYSYQVSNPAQSLEATQKPTAIIEERRLAHLVHSIDHSTSVVPRGAYVLKANEEVIPNDLFTGLDRYDSSKLINYVHLRRPEKLPFKDLLQKEHLNQSLDFADTINEDIPNKSWALQYDESYSVVLGKSLLWPGYIFYHVPGTRTFGSYYVGNGIKNQDLCFMSV